MSIKILYGICAFGNGNASRATLLIDQLRARGADVDCLFSCFDNPDKKLADIFEPTTRMRGARVSHSPQSGVDLPRAYRNFALHDSAQFVRDVMALDMSGYDLVITDYEPVTAWAARVKGITSIGVAHQYALRSNIARPFALIGSDWHAPPKIPLASHWMPFGHKDIIPPMLNCSDGKDAEPGKILVYLPWEDKETLIEFLKPFQNKQFLVYAKSDVVETPAPHITLMPRSPEFANDMETCEGMLCNAGYMSMSQALHMGKKLMVIPQRGQPEQLSNAMALEKIQAGAWMSHLDSRLLGQWLEDTSAPKQIRFPHDVSSRLANWMMAGDYSRPDRLAEGLWKRTEFFGFDDVPHLLSA